MVEQELRELILQIQRRECEGQTLEIKAAHKGCPEKLYDTISAFSNQDSGGTFVFGLDERAAFRKVGVYDAQDLQKKVMEYCEQMTPVVRPVFTVCDEEDLIFVSAEIPPLDVTERPCFKTAKGRLHGSYIRVGDADKPMSEYEVYSYEAFRKRLQDDIRCVEEASPEDLDALRLEEYLLRRKKDRPHLVSFSRERLCEMTSILRGGKVTLAALLLFGVYPQAYFPQFSIIATSVPGTEIGLTDDQGHRFLDSKRIEGSLHEMLDGALAFVRNNMRVSMRIDPRTGKRVDTPQYPMGAIREAVLNALVHRDYSRYTESRPIQLNMYTDRIEITNPGGLYGRLTLDSLGKIQPDTRNPVLATAMETLGETENRYSGIPSIRLAMQEMGLPAPVFMDSRSDFRITLYNAAVAEEETSAPGQESSQEDIDPKGLLEFCLRPRTRREIMEHIGIASKQYSLRRYLTPLIERGMIRMTMPEKPQSSNQRYVTQSDAAEKQ